MMTTTTSSSTHDAPERAAQSAEAEAGSRGGRESLVEALLQRVFLAELDAVADAFLQGTRSRLSLGA